MPTEAKITTLLIPLFNLLLCVKAMVVHEVTWWQLCWHLTYFRLLYAQKVLALIFPTRLHNFLCLFLVPECTFMALIGCIRTQIIMPRSSLHIWFRTRNFVRHEILTFFMNWGQRLGIDYARNDASRLICKRFVPPFSCYQNPWFWCLGWSMFRHFLKN